MTEPLTPMVSALGTEVETDDPDVELIRANLAVPELSTAAKERIRQRLVEAHPRPRLLLWRPAVLVGALAASSLATATVIYYRPASWRRATVVVPSPPRIPAKVVHPPVPEAVPVPEAPPLPEAPALPETPAPPPFRHVNKPARHATSPQTAMLPGPASAAEREEDSSTPDIPLPPPPAPSRRPPPVDSSPPSLPKEMANIRVAINALNLEGNPGKALKALDAYQAAFPNGVYRKEAVLYRVNALLKLGQRREALAELEKVGLDSLRALPKGRELWVVRAELLEEAGDCATAEAAFSDAVATETGPLGERALWGRAKCRATLGDAGGQRADLERYLQLYPSGLFAQKARSALTGLDGR
jgi:hypothetical protein